MKSSTWAGRVIRLLSAFVLTVATGIAALPGSDAMAAEPVVVDSAAILSSRTETTVDNVNSKLKAYDDTPRIFVVTVPTLGGQSIENVAHSSLVRYVDVMSQNTNIVYVIAKREHRQALVSYGEDKVITKSKAESIIADATGGVSMTADSDNWDAVAGKVVNGVLAAEIDADAAPPTPEEKHEQDVGMYCGFGVFVMIVALMIAAVHALSKE